MNSIEIRKAGITELSADAAPGAKRLTSTLFTGADEQFSVGHKYAASYEPGPDGRFAVSFTSPLINFYAGIRAVVTGIEMIPTDTRFLFVCNHRSMFDPLLTMESLRDYDISFITKPSNLKIPVAGRVAYAVGYLPIDRENDRNALKTILTAADYMKRDVCSIAVYPEGTRSKTKELLPFHAGCLKAAQRAKVPIVVAAMSGTERFQKMTVFAGAKVNLDILEVIPAETVCQMRTDALSNHIREKIQADLDRREREES